jgi:hypothetical protein
MNSINPAASYASLGSGNASVWLLLRRYLLPALAIFLLIHFPIRALAHLSTSRSGLRDYWSSPIMGVLIANLLLLLSFVLVEGTFISYVLAAEQGRPSLANAVRHAGRRFGTLLLARIIYFVVIAVGLAMFVVPGIILAILFMFHAWIIVAEDQPAISALRRSATLLRAHLFPTLRRVLPVALATAAWLGSGFVVVGMTLRTVRPFPILKLAPLTMTLVESGIILPVLLAGVLFFYHRSPPSPIALPNS